MVCRKCARYFSLERNARDLCIKGLWDIRKPFDTPPNLCDHVLRCYDEVHPFSIKCREPSHGSRTDAMA